MHAELTQMAFDVLEPRARAIWAGCADDLIAEYCFWPDDWLSPEKHPRIGPYQLVIEGLQFHYPPIDHTEEEYAQWRMDDAGRPQPVDFGPNRNWQFFRTGVTHYLQAICDDVAAGRVQDAARRLGILLHFFQETHELHALESAQGMDIFVLDRLLPEPAGDVYLTPTTCLIHGAPARGDISGYEPALEGVTIAESVLRLYSRYARVLAANRRLHLPIVLARQAGREDEAEQYFRDITENAARLSADVWHTVTALATQRFDPRQADELEVVHLDCLSPVRRPRNASASMYRFCAMVPGACLDRQRHRHPLTLRLADGQSRTFAHGWGGGGHPHAQTTVYDIPAGVYRGLKGVIGLHDPLGLKGRVDLAIQCGAATVLNHRLEPDAPTAAVDIAVHDGGEIRFTVRDAGPGDPDDNNLAWCDLRLTKH